MTTKGVMHLSKGDVFFELYDSTPNTSRNFVELAQSGFYNGLHFHRVIDDFVVQGGCPYSKSLPNPRVGTGGPGYSIACETSPTQRHIVGALSMAHAGKNTGGSQFFIVLDEDNTRHLNGVHTVFGRVTDGMDIVKQIKVGDEIKSIEITEISDVIKNHKLEIYSKR